MEELRREREGDLANRDERSGRPRSGREGDPDRPRRDRIEGLPPPWVPTIFVRKPRP